MLRRDLEQQILSGILTPGSRLPGENQLAATYKVSRGTVRQALAGLERRGRIETHPGSGSYVAEPGGHVEFDRQPIDTSLGWSAAIGRFGLQASTRTIRQGRAELPALAAELGLPAPDFVVIDRLRLLPTGEAIRLERSHIPWNERTEWLLDVDFTSNSLFQALDTSGMHPVRGVERVELCRLNSEDAELLARPAGEPFFLASQTTWDAMGDVVEHVNTLLDPAHFRLQLRFNERE
jgi:GntR family transcriptional regulator